MVVSLQGDATKAVAHRVECPRSDASSTKATLALPVSQRCAHRPIWEGQVCEPSRISSIRTHIGGSEDETAHDVSIYFFEYNPLTFPTPVFIVGKQ